MVGLFGVHIYSTSLRRRPVVWAARRWILRQPTGWIVRPFIVSDDGGLPTRLGTLWCLDSKLETPRAIGFCYVLTVNLPFSSLCFADAACHMCYQGAPCCPDQGADPGRHVRSLDKCIYRSNPVLSTFCFLHVLLLGVIEFYYPVLSTGILSFSLVSFILLQDLLYLTAGSGTKCVHFTLR